MSFLPVFQIDDDQCAIRSLSVQHAEAIDLNRVRYAGDRAYLGVQPVGDPAGAIIAFAIITETVFQWPGTGLMFIQAVDFVDVPIMAAYLVFVALLFVLINLVVDILYAVLDPRVRLSDQKA